MCTLQNIILGANFSSAKIFANSSSLHMNNVHCSGTEVTLIDCSYKKTYNNTDHYNVVVVKCNGKSLQFFLFPRRMKLFIDVVN